MPRRLQILRAEGLPRAAMRRGFAAVLAATVPTLALAETSPASAELEEAWMLIDAQSDEWMLDHLAAWLRANGCTVSKDRQEEFQDGVLTLVLENLRVPTELHADLIPGADDRMGRAAEAWEASGRTFEDLGLFMDDNGETLRLDPC